MPALTKANLESLREGAMLESFLKEKSTPFDRLQQAVPVSTAGHVTSPRVMARQTRNNDRVKELLAGVGAQFDN